MVKDMKLDRQRINETVLGTYLTLDQIGFILRDAVVAASGLPSYQTLGAPFEVTWDDGGAKVSMVIDHLANELKATEAEEPTGARLKNEE